MRPSAFPVIGALTQIKQEVFLPLSLATTAAATGAASTPRDWSEHGLVQPGELRANPDFVQWIRNYNRMSATDGTCTRQYTHADRRSALRLHADSANRALSLQTTLIYRLSLCYCISAMLCSAHAYQLHCLLSLLQATPLQSSLLGIAAPHTDGSSSSSSNGGSTQAILPVPPPHHRVRITMLQFLGLPVTDPFVAAR